MPTEKTEWLSVAEVAAALRVSEWLIRSLLVKGLPHIRLGDTYRLRLQEVEDFLRKPTHKEDEHG